MSELVGQLFWRTDDGVLRELKQVPLKELQDFNLNFTGIPIVFAVWPTPAGPVAEALNEVNPDVSHGEGDAEIFLEALADRGYEITKKGDV